jgi:superfamily II DNA or RNA helicase
MPLKSNLKTYLSNRGYGILKTDDNKEQIDEIKRELTVTPKLMSSAPFVTNKEYPIYMESDNKLYIPKCYGLSKFGKPDIDNLSSGVDCPNLVFYGELRDIQKKPIDAYIKSAENVEKMGGIISVPCGFGKTIMSIYIACYFKKKTLFISHKNFLNEQFITSIKDFIPKVRIGKIKGDKIDIVDKDIVIATLQSLALRDYDPKIFKDFGLVIIDECHHIASEIFSRAFRKMNIRITLGLSATLNRKDGLRKVFEWYLGNSVFNFKVDKSSCDMIVQIHKYFASASEYSAIKTFYNGQPNLVASINNICNYKPRTLLIIEILKSILATDKDRKILILSERKNQLKTIEDLIKEDNIGSYGYYIGGMKMSDLDISATKQIILATYQMSSEGLNIPTLNTLILASPIGDIQQSVGRILREKKEVRKYIPLCIDIFDDLSIIKSKGYRRLKYYKSNGYIIKNFTDNIYVNDYIYDDSGSDEGKKRKILIYL